MSNKSQNVQLLQKSLQLPCGVVIKNRLAKSAMSDSLGNGEGNPTNEQIRLYEKWACGGISLSFIGEVQCDPRFPEKPGNLVINHNSDFELLAKLARRASSNGAHIWPQIGHAGALSHIPISKPRGPSAIDIEGLCCTEISVNEIKALPDMYAEAASLVKNVGFSGIHIHAGHGFLLSQFLSPLFNKRNDAYGGSITNRSRIIIEIINKVRNVVGRSFPIGVRINSSDQLDGGLAEVEALALIKLLNKTSLDLIDISGGTYFPGAKSSSETTSNDVYFLEFAKMAKKITNIPLMLTGGFKQRSQAIDALESGAADIIGLGRGMVLDHQLANSWLTEAGGDPVFPKFETIIDGGITAWYTMRINAIAEDKEDEFSQDLASAIHAYEKRDAQKSLIWSKKFTGQTTASDHVPNNIAKP